jgi:hypothetical protein
MPDLSESTTGFTPAELHELEEERRDLEWAATHPDVAPTNIVLVPLTEEEAAADFGSAAPAVKATRTERAADAWWEHKTLSLEHLFEQEDPDWFLDGLLPEASISVLHGPGGTKKTFLMLDWMMCAAHGLQWQGYDVKPGKVLYIAGEGSSGLRKRIKAWGAGRGIDPNTDNFRVMPEAFNLYAATPEQVANVALAIARAEISYIVVDTLHRSSPGGSENDSEVIGQVYANAVAMAGGPDGAALWFLHHDTKPSKASKATFRGSSSIRDDADVVVQIAAVSPLVSVLAPDKLKEAEDFTPINITFGVIGEDNHSSLFVQTLQSDEIVLVPEKPAKVKAAEAINLLQLDITWGEIRLTAALKEAGYPFGKNTVAEAKKLVLQQRHDLDQAKQVSDVRP